MSAFKVLMPKIGQAMTEGTVVEWHRQDGDPIALGETLVTIETDKAAYEMEAQAAGSLVRLVPEGEEVPVGTVIGLIGEPGVNVTEPKPPPSSRPMASPKARHLAAQSGIDLAQVTASAADGVISVADVRAVAPADAAGATAGPRLTHPIRERRPLTGIHKTSARRLEKAWKAPHVVQMVDVDASRLVGLLADKSSGLSLNDVLLWTAAAAMSESPYLNGTLVDDALHLYEGVDIGLAVDTPRGLVVPVIRGADRLTLGQVAERSRQLIEAARRGRLGPLDVGDASLTISNLGMFGVKFGTPVLNLDESVLIFVGAIEDRAVVVDGRIAIRSTITLSIAFDHRVADGVAAAKFVGALKSRLEGPPDGEASPNAAKEVTAAGSFGEVADDHEGRSVRATSDFDGYTVAISAGAHEWCLDEPVGVGGMDRGPDPVTALLGALSGCMIISYKSGARRRKLDVASVSATVSLGPGQSTPIRLDLVVSSTAPEDRLKALLETAKRSCTVSRMLQREVVMALQVVLP